MQTTARQAIHTFNYDARGNAILRDGVILAFDDANRLTSVANKESYAYDAFGHRVYKANYTNGGKTYFLYGRDGTLLYEYDNLQQITRDYVYLAGTLVAQIQRYVVDTPGAITFSQASPSNGLYTIYWGSVFADYYDVQEQANGGAWVAVAQLPGPRQYTPPQREGGTYVYRVRACRSGTCSNWTVSVPMNVTPSFPVITVPSGTQTKSYRISWNVPATATSFDVEEQKDGGAWTRLATSTTATYVDRPGNVAGNYLYRVEAKSAYGTRGWAVSANVPVQPVSTSPPLTPTSLTAPSYVTTGTTFSVSWSSSSGATSYELHRTNVDTGAVTTEYTGPATSTSDSIGISHFFQYAVRACNAYGCSGWKSAPNMTDAEPAGGPK